MTIDASMVKRLVTQTGFGLWSAWENDDFGLNNLIAFAKAVAAYERERCANMLNLSRSEAQLMAGELTAQEWRTLSAVLVSLQKRMRSKDEK